MGLVAKNVFKALGDPPQNILKNINLEIKDGEFVALTGKSGSGKSTLLYLLSSLDLVSQGEMLIDETDTKKMTSEILHQFRNEKMGFIFQFHYLLPELSAIENVLMPTFKNNMQDQLLDRAHALIEMVGLSERKHNKPHQLSGGEQQRVAIARALIMSPKYVFADEPTGALDTANADAVISLLEKVNRTEKTTVVMVTHDPDFAALAHRQIILSDGQVIKDLSQKKP